MLLRVFEVSNYKSIKSLAIETPPFMFLVGPNGAGKTNVVRAMELLGELLRNGDDPSRHVSWSQIVRRGKGQARGGITLGAWAEFGLGTESVQAGVQLVLQSRTGDEVQIASESLDVRLRSGGKLTARRLGEEVECDLRDADAALLNMIVPSAGDDLRAHRAKVAAHLKRQGETFTNANGLRLLTTSLGPIFPPIQQCCRVTRLRLDTSALRSDARYGGDHLGPSGEGLPVMVDRLRGRGEAPAKAFLPLLAALQEVYPRIEDVVPEAFAQGRVTLNFREKGIKDPIPLDGISDGVLHALALLVALRQPGPGSLAIEEPENALHPWSVRRILERAQSLGGRGRAPRHLLITTHSETVVNAVRDPKSLFIVESGKNGTTVTPATTKESALESTLRESGQQLGDLWMDGTLGGVPGAS